MRICRERATGKVFAMKKLQKSEMVRRGQVDHVKAERNVLTEVRCTAALSLSLLTARLLTRADRTYFIRC